MKKLFALVCALALILCSVSAFAQETTRYSAVTKGRNGEMTVEVEFNGEEIAAVHVVEHSESAGVADPAISMMPERIVEKQSIAVDVVTGATITSAAILNAVSDCIAQAGLNSENYQKNEKPERTFAELETDVLVIGGGGSGLSAAIEARNQGANVLLLERLTTLGGNTKLSQGMVLRGREADEDESAMTADEVYQQFYNYGSGNEGFNAEMVKNFAEKMAENTA